MSRPIERLHEVDREIQLLDHTSALLGWDEETNMPPRAIDERAEQVALLQGIIHARLDAPDVKDLIESSGEPEDPAEAAFLRAFRRRHRRETRLPAELVTELAKAGTVGQSVWREARKRADFAHFAPSLKRIVELTVEKARCLGFEQHPYDALLDEYEPWMTMREVKTLFDPLASRLSGLTARIAARPQVDDRFLHGNFPIGPQLEFAGLLLRAMGYDLERGRLDQSAHPFTTTLGRDDARITARYSPKSIASGLFSVIHEAGHALYEQGFGEGLRGTILANGASLGIHESQSRLWENVIGRSLPFWRHFLPALAALFPAELQSVGAEAFYRGINRVEPSLIRVEADEVTYGLHIVLRFGIECRLVAGELPVDDLPEAWNAEMERLLGLRPANAAEGLLQDVHWSFGGIGYFPTYALGNLYAAQFVDTMRRELPSFEQQIEQGDLSATLRWLREKIHRKGASRSAAELCADVTGAPLDPAHFVRYLEEKYAPIYGL